ncbi:peptide chain release factor N(5)-glutamine methyltransferase [Roseococcus sp. SYP-B2431]|uniref:peptide chain release factor N(5)-glutamine methyltransferase n=1 Tax=Roseococcus sp. SYP-B2431 TaxID=2496640 RepID=UPI00103EE129|nr:peptide chain release factor N(5)-glutamine methyltransferase [Roseococcus sp. SYP-B2431]TCI00108.1 peptide chain release factor N(5)-glutamine methyltransferase [Roseococcus sp. SYP-B2431]
MTTVGALLCQGGRALREAGIADSRREARLLLAHALDSSTEALLRDPGAEVAPEAAGRFRSLLTRRAGREPVAQITGHAGFWTLDLEVGPQTLVPRADSEALIEALLGTGIVPRRILDLGTGTGCLLLAALAEFPGAHGVGIDLIPDAAALASRNAARNGLEDRGSFLAGRWAEAISGRFDVILSNPPYIESGAIAGLMPEVSRHEPASALDGGPDGLDAYRTILSQLPRLLTPAGIAVLELGEGQGPAVSALAESAGLRVLGGHEDLGGITRALLLALQQKPVGGSPDPV